MDDGYPYQCCLPGEGGCWGWDNENPPDTDGDGDTQDPGNGSPILIDLDGNGFHLTGLNDAVLFDISGSGDPRHYSWTRAGSGDGFLCRDRDGSGGIETGRELFGDATLLSNGSRASNGFQALRELDSGAQGGNADGRLTIDDRMFQLLCIWVDEDHDGRSGASEIMSLWQAGVLELSVEYQESRRRDAHGNEFRYKSSTIVANRAGRPRRATTYDVFFVSRPAS